MTFKHEKRIPPVIWIIVANRAQARIFAADWPQPDTWVEALKLDHSESSLAPHDVNTDRQGTFAEVAGGHHAGQEETDFQHQMAEHFSGQLIDVLEQARVENKFGKLAVVTAPLLLGVLRKKLPSTLAKMVVLEVDKDYTHLMLDDIRKHLQGEFATLTPESGT